jgi:hypothetical protein
VEQGWSADDPGLGGGAEIRARAKRGGSRWRARSGELSREPARWREASDVAAGREDKLGGGILSPDDWRSFLHKRWPDEDDHARRKNQKRRKKSG